MEVQGYILQSYEVCSGKTYSMNVMRVVVGSMVNVVQCRRASLSDLRLDGTDVW